MYFEQDEWLARRDQFKFAKEIMKALPYRPFYTLIVNSTNAELHTQNDTVFRKSNNTITTILDPKLANRQSLVNNLPKLNIVNSASSSTNKQPPTGRSKIGQSMEARGAVSKSPKNTMSSGIPSLWCKSRSKPLGWVFSSRKPRYSSHWAHFAIHITSTFSPLPLQSKVARIWEGINRSNAELKRDWTHSNWIGLTCHFHIQKGWDNSLLRSLSENNFLHHVRFVPEKDGRIRFYVGYKNSYSMKMKDLYPLPRIEKYIDSVGDAQVFSTLKASSGYGQTEVDKEVREKISLTFHHSLHPFIRISICLENTLATFQRVKDVVRSTVKW